jgi:hypothetical protein
LRAAGQLPAAPRIHVPWGECAIESPGAMRWRTVELRKLKRDEDQESNEATDESGPPLWLRLAQDELAFRSDVGPGGSREFLDRVLQMEARLKGAYPNMPFQLRHEFEARLSANGYTDEAWNAAVTRLESTDWFKSHERDPGKR